LPGALAAMLPKPEMVLTEDRDGPDSILAAGLV
jgi:hypothetical protein